MAKNNNSALANQLVGLSIASGVFAILFGVLALFWPGLTVALLIVFFGVFLLVWSVVGLITSLTSMGSDKFWWLELIFSILALGLAVYVLRNPVETAKIFVFFIGITFLVRGVIDVIEGIFVGGQDGGSRVFHIILGVIGVLAGVITLSNPVSAGVAVVWVVGLYAILYGSVVIAFSSRAHHELNK